ncbi:uncharacterized protein [Henckelia pumila]|uniref:uncharacterized protein n=1 Tax=Henckelia pumila TaxID=405737 RepID=UPI003C6DB90C
MNSTEKHITKHFSHEHPLTFNDDESLDADDDGKPKFCSICGLIIFINSYYSCSHVQQGCHFLVHEICAHRLPQQLRVTPAFNSRRPDDYSPYSDYERYSLYLCGPNDNDIANKKCIKCGQICKNYTYSIPTNHYFHPLCLLHLEIVTKHRSHDHPLSAMRKEICAFCNACGEEERGFFWSCQTCDYWISQDCALIQPVAMHASHSHPLVLFYNNLDIDPRLFFNFDFCRICRECIGVKSFYSCGICQYSVHLKCIKSSIRNMTPGEEWRKLIVHFPAPKKGTVFFSSIANIIEQEEEVDGTSTSISASRPEKCHEHQLILRGTSTSVVDDMEDGSKTLCNGCINPINSTTPYYPCSVAQCHFLLHDLCAKLPSRIKGKFHNPSPWFLFTKCEEFVSVFCCLFCKYEYTYIRYYKCTTCPAFNIHLRCALLPREVRHKFDEHPLQLIADGGNLVGLSIYRDWKYLENCGFCEVCEKPMDPNIWFYYCSECDQYFHVNCIPSVGKMSKMKFGGTLDHVGCHEHPVTSVRMLTIGSQKCTYCNKIIQGFQDDYWAFHCESCNVWIHKDCARNIYWESKFIRR